MNCSKDVLVLLLRPGLDCDFVSPDLKSAVTFTFAGQNLLSLPRKTHTGHVPLDHPEQKEEEKHYFFSLPLLSPKLRSLSQIYA